MLRCACCLWRLGRQRCFSGERCDALFVEHCAGLGVLCLCRARRPPELLRTRQPSEAASCLLVSYMPLARGTLVGQGASVRGA